MQVLFKYPRKVMQKLYLKGTHILPDEAKDDWFFKGLVAAKDVEVVLAATPPKQEPVLEVPIKSKLGKKKSTKVE